MAYGLWNVFGRMDSKTNGFGMDLEFLENPYNP